MDEVSFMKLETSTVVGLLEDEHASTPTRIALLRDDEKFFYRPTVPQKSLANCHVSFQSVGTW